MGTVSSQEALLMCPTCNVCPGPPPTSSPTCLCTVLSFSAICAAAAVPLSTICASSSTTRHHLRRVSGVGSTAYLHKQYSPGSTIQAVQHGA